MRDMLLSASVLCSVVLCASAAAGPEAQAAYRGAAQQAQAANADESFTATVKRDEARFVFPVPSRREWKWRRTETKDNAQEYRMDVTLKNEGKEYAFGFYLWKRSGAAPQSGSFSDLVRAGQASVFERAQSRLMTIVRDAGVKVKHEGERLVVTVGGRKNVARLFSGRPAEVTFTIAVPGETKTSKVVPVKYQD